MIMKRLLFVLVLASSAWADGWTSLVVKANPEPEKCSQGGIYFNSDYGTLRACTAPGVWDGPLGSTAEIGNTVTSGKINLHMNATPADSSLNWLNYAATAPIWQIGTNLLAPDGNRVALRDYANARTIFQSTPGAGSTLETPNGIASAVGTRLFPAWSSGTSYVLGAQVSVGGINYTAGGPSYYCPVTGSPTCTSAGFPAANLNHAPPNTSYWNVYTPSVWSGSGSTVGEFMAAYGAAPSVGYFVTGSQANRVTTHNPAMTLGSIATGTMYPYVGELNIISDRVPIGGGACPTGTYSPTEPSCTLGFGESIYVTGSNAGYQIGGLTVLMVNGASDGFVTNLECQLFSVSGICGSEVDVGNDTGSDGAGNGDYGTAVFSYGFDMQGQGGHLNSAAMYIQADASSGFKHGIDFVNGSIAASGTWGTGYAIILPNNIWVSARNSTATAFDPILRVDASDHLQLGSIPTSAGAGGLYLCIDTSGNVYKKSSCP